MKLSNTDVYRLEGPRHYLAEMSAKNFLSENITILQDAVNKVFDYMAKPRYKIIIDESCYGRSGFKFMDLSTGVVKNSGNLPNEGTYQLYSNILNLGYQVIYTGESGFNTGNVANRIGRFIRWSLGKQTGEDGAHTAGEKFYNLFTKDNLQEIFTNDIYLNVFPTEVFRDITNDLILNDIGLFANDDDEKYNLEHFSDRSVRLFLEEQLGKKYNWWSNLISIQNFRYSDNFFKTLIQWSKVNGKERI